MGFDIEAIKNAALKAYAKRLDSEDHEGGIKNNKKLEGAELSIFLSADEQVLGNDKEAMDELMNIKFGLRKTEEAKLVKRHEDFMQRREELKHMTLEDIKKDLKSSTMKSISNYLELHKNDDDTYDLSELSFIIEACDGADFVVNKRKGPFSEFGVIAQQFKNAGVVDDEVKDKVIKDLIKFCKCEIGNVPQNMGLVGAMEMPANENIDVKISGLDSIKVSEPKEDESPKADRVVQDERLGIGSNVNPAECLKPIIREDE